MAIRIQVNLRIQICKIEAAVKCVHMYVIKDFKTPNTLVLLKDRMTPKNRGVKNFCYKFKIIHKHGPAQQDIISASNEY